MAARTFKADRETGITVATFDGVHIRIEAGETYSTSDPREIEVLSDNAAVVEVKPAAVAKKKG